VSVVSQIIKDEVRNKLSRFLLCEISLDYAIKISIEGANMKDFDFPSVYSKWLSAKNRKSDSDTL